MKPHQVGLEISYDGTRRETGADTAASGGTGDSTAYTVLKGDNLWNIAKRFYGNGVRYMTIYSANAETIEAAAKARGKVNSYKGSTAGWWIWPGEVLAIPGITSGMTQLGTAPKKAVTADYRLGEKIAGQATAFSYVDAASGQSDSISITLQDIEKEWIGKLMPERGASLGAKIKLINWDSKEREDIFNCGSFIIDDISFSGRPLSCVIGGVSVPTMDDFKSLPVTNTWEKTTLQDIATQIATKAGIALYYDADTVQIAEIEQSKQTDSAFLYALCEKYGLAMKVYNQKIVIFDIVKSEEKNSVWEIREGDTNAWSFNITIDGTYTGVNLDYTDPDTGDTIKVTMGEPGRMYAINTQASGRYDAELQAAAKVNAANRSIQTMQVTIRANTKVVASHCVTVSGFGRLDGKYYVDKIKHSLGKGYTMQLSMHKVQPPIKATAPAKAAGGGGQTYTVRPGDTLWGISKRFYGAGSKYHIIYEANVEVIESAAKVRGKKDSGNGHFIWAGEVLTIPEK